MTYIVLTSAFITIVSFAVALAVTLFIESPIMGLERALRR
jgi:hypothetical protein